MSPTRRFLLAIQPSPSTSPRSLRDDSTPPTDGLSRLSACSKPASLLARSAKRSRRWRNCYFLADLLSGGVSNLPLGIAARFICCGDGGGGGGGGGLGGLGGGGFGGRAGRC